MSLMTILLELWTGRNGGVHRTNHIVVFDWFVCVCFFCLFVRLCVSFSLFVCLFVCLLYDC